MSGRRLTFGKPIEDAITRLRFAPKSNNLLVSSWDSCLRLYDVDASMPRLEAQTEAALLDCCFQDEFVAYSAGSDGSIHRYDLHSGNQDTIGNHDNSATCAEYSDETCLVITGGWDRKIFYWDARATNVIQSFTSLGQDVESMSLFGFDVLVATETSVNVYDLRNLKEVVHTKHSDMGIRIRCVRSIPYLKGFAIGSIDGRVTLELPYLSSTDEMGYTFRCHPKSRNGKYYLAAVNDISFNPLFFGAFVTGDYEGYAISWDARSRKRLFELPRYPNSVASLSYNHTGELLAVASGYTYQEANEIEDPPEIFIQELGESYMKSLSAGSSCRT
ncbi:hypothetical protein Nepgr_003607 [Nepenthes gracilis]|uniref:Mitotic checkpoint protein BUB3.3 n=1 Tax=Nepenthes gracilis TaxID=150966 RepID=A0AAD3XDV7_NEPGR|nr:hypothetical protein Nepgr_003607 [Nepenthes gracilis]